jgi:streptogramin lyase
MRLVEIHQAREPRSIYINPESVSWIEDNGANIIIKMSCGKVITTKFTTSQHAADYLLRAEPTLPTQGE